MIKSLFVKFCLNKFYLFISFIVGILIFILVIESSLQAKSLTIEKRHVKSNRIESVDAEDLLFFLLIPAKMTSFITNTLGRSIYPKGRLYKLPPYKSHQNPYWVPGDNGNGDRSAIEIDFGYHYVGQSSNGLRTSGVLRQSGGGSLDFSYLHYFKNKSSRGERNYFNIHSNVNLSPWRKIIWEVGLGFTSFNNRSSQKLYDGPSLKNSVTFFPFDPLVFRTEYIYSPLDNNSLNDYEMSVYLLLSERFNFSAGLKSIRNISDDELTGPTAELNIWF